MAGGREVVGVMVLLVPGLVGGLTVGLVVLMVLVVGGHDVVVVAGRGRVPV